MGEGLVVIPYLAGVNIKLADLSGGGLAAAMPLGQRKFRRSVEGIGSLAMLCFGICSLAVEAPHYMFPGITAPVTALPTRRRNSSGRFRGTTATASMGRVGFFKLWVMAQLMSSHARIRDLA